VKAFWWFKDNSIAGMARPGFNAVHWSDLPLDEGVLLGWVGQYSSGSASMESFRTHLKVYAPRVVPFFKMTADEAIAALKIFDDVSGFHDVANRLAQRSKAYSQITVSKDEVHISMCDDRLQYEADSLKKLGVNRIVSLTEQHHGKDFLSEHFDLHHLSIEDLGAPTHDQALALADILSNSKRDGETVAVHCLAGIGRTSTMLMAAHLAMGHSFDEIKTNLAKRNPRYEMKGSQGEFIKAFRDKLGS
jgi:predicted protein tyrosine phosphatase